jgi:Mrp family chromosome partitioning ATPase
MTWCGPHSIAWHGALSEEISGKLIYVNSNNNEAFHRGFQISKHLCQFANISRPPKQILITSPLQGEGKTMLSVNAAMSLLSFLAGNNY